MNDKKLERKIKRKVLFRVLKKVIGVRSLIFLIIILSANTAAWFIYVKEVHNNVSVKVRAWNVIMSNGDTEIVDNLSLNISNAYPGMPIYTSDTTIYNQGDSQSKFTYTIMNMSIFGDVINTAEKIIQDGGVPGVDNPTSDELKSLLLDSDTYPFKIQFLNDNDVLAANTGSTVFTVKMIWDYETGNDELDTKWGIDAYNFVKDNPGENCITMDVKLKVTQLAN